MENETIESGKELEVADLTEVEIQVEWNKNSFQLYTYAYVIHFESPLVNKSYISFIT